MFRTFSPIGVRPGTCTAAMALLLSLIACGCSEGINGTYQDAEGMARLEFEDGNRVYFTFLGTTVLSEYEVDGDRLILKNNGQTQVLTRNGESIEGFGPLELKLLRVDAGR